MGCCISKCRPDPKHSLAFQHQFNHRHHQIQNNLNVISPSPPSPTSSSASSISSFTRTTTTSSNNTISSASSFSSASSSSSALTKVADRSFSNEFLWSCYKENPHIARINSIREASLSLTPRHHHGNYIKTPSPQNGAFHMPQKRVRSNSPTNLTRQKSLRKEPPVGPINRNMSPSRTPSPSRRFIGDNNKCGIALGPTNHNSTKVSSVAHSYSVSSSCMKKDQGVNKAANSTNNISRRFLRAGLKHREACNLRAGSKIDETVVKDVVARHHDGDEAMMEDIDNPLISLDCFIFL